MHGIHTVADQHAYVEAEVAEVKKVTSDGGGLVSNKSGDVVKSDDVVEDDD